MTSLIETFGFGAKGWGGQLLLAVVMTLAVTLAAMAKQKALGHLKKEPEEAREDAKPKAEQKEAENAR